MSGYKIRGAGAISEAAPSHKEQPDTAVMTSPVKSPHSSSLSRSERSTPRPQPSSACVTPTAAPPLVQGFMKAFSEYTQSVVETALVQARFDVLSNEERRQKDENSRWSRYYGDFIAIGEDQSRNLKAIEEAKQKSERRLKQAKQASEKTMRLIANNIFAATNRSLPVIDDDITTREKHNPIDQSEEIASLKKEVTKLKLSAVNTKSDYHHLREIAEIQKVNFQTTLKHSSLSLRSVKSKNCLIFGKILYANLYFWISKTGLIRNGRTFQSKLIVSPTSPPNKMVLPPS